MNEIGEEGRFISGRCEPQMSQISRKAVISLSISSRGHCFDAAFDIDNV